MIPGLAATIKYFRDWFSPTSKLRYDWNIHIKWRKFSKQLPKQGQYLYACIRPGLKRQCTFGQCPCTFFCTFTMSDVVYKPTPCNVQPTIRSWILISSLIYYSRINLSLCSLPLLFLRSSFAKTMKNFCAQTYAWLRPWLWYFASWFFIKSILKVLLQQIHVPYLLLQILERHWIL